MGYYDKFLNEYFTKNPHRQAPGTSIDAKLSQKKTVLLGLAFNEQIVDEVPLENTDVVLDDIVSAWLYHHEMISTNEKNICISYTINMTNLFVWRTILYDEPFLKNAFLFHVWFSGNWILAVKNCLDVGE